MLVHWMHISPGKVFRHPGLFVFLQGLALFFSQTAGAVVTLVELDRLHLGTLAVSRNDQAYSIDLASNGYYSFSASLVVVTPGQPGRYKLSGLPPLQLISLELQQSTLNRPGNLPPSLLVSGSGPVQSLRSDQNGELILTLGARVTTDGVSNGYPDGDYVGGATLQLSYPTLDNISISNLDVDIDLTLRSYLSAVEEKALDFGTIAVWGAAGEQASMTLSPIGSVQTVNGVSARILSYGNAAPGVFRVTGGAANVPISLTLPSAPVSLTRTGVATPHPHLIVDNFAWFPASPLKLNSQGEIEFSLGARLRTEQTTTPYLQGPYSGNFVITIEYP